MMSEREAQRVLMIELLVAGKINQKEVKKDWQLACGKSGASRGASAMLAYTGSPPDCKPVYLEPVERQR